VIAVEDQKARAKAEAEFDARRRVRRQTDDGDLVGLGQTVDAWYGEPEPTREELAAFVALLPRDEFGNPRAWGISDAKLTELWITAAETCKPEEGPVNNRDASDVAMSAIGRQIRLRMEHPIDPAAAAETAEMLGLHLAANIKTESDYQAVLACCMTWAAIAFEGWALAEDAPNVLGFFAEQSERVEVEG
jgi:hypothetical protein